MTDKKRRQRGTRTHGGGTQKNRRGAGNRGGRGDAGREKHEHHQHEPLGKHGFTRPPELQDEVLEISVRDLDEDAPLFAERGKAAATDAGYTIDARDIVEGGHEADVVKVLGDGQVRRNLTVTADAFSDTAVERIEASGGEAIVSERAKQSEESSESQDDG